ncbi:hypothetical protein ELQ12_08240 [Campylobacter sp. US25a]|uniref:DUF996 domain-containing protein n=1 Tax=Campylobacter jejuni TaxID=197 RepID=A0AB36G433_CAMJU|nr:hypothetical protein [Campylobacter sp. US25a]EEA6200082.1 hypothetical protein [Campylobacter jejuni]EEA6200628.1 hypothetical protein [Campylobacter jejuni]OEV50597.1 hypothetical protein AJY60_00775 [Campylobacter jejuni]TEY07104.1 hypothetical protein ELQ12_08240 [Campylobacter sp. US25a]GKY27766.1 hypothetical protein THJ062_10340 [Campylobacter jejuni]
MHNLNEALFQKKIKEIRLKAIASIICGFLGIIPYLGVLFALASWILFFIVLYDLKIYGGAKNLFKNFLISVGIGFFGILINISSLFVILESRNGFFANFYFNQDYVVIGIFCVLFVITLALIFPFFKAFSYEITRVTKQKYFIYAFNTCFLGLITLIIGIGLVFLLASLVFWILAWVKFKEFDEQELSNLGERLAKAQKKVFDFDLKWIKITMASFIILNLLVLTFSFILEIISFEDLRFYYTKKTLLYTAIILALLSVFLFCKKIKNYKLFIYFFIWQGLSVFGSYLLFVPDFMVDQQPEIVYGSLNIILSLCHIIFAFLFFKILIQITKEKLFYLIFAFYVCIKILIILIFFIFMMVDNYYIFTKSPIKMLIDNYKLLFQVVYFVSFLIVWLMLKGQKNVKIC